MQDRPTARELVGAVRDFLEMEILPGLEGRRRFHGLVAVNVLAIVARELEHEAAHLDAERARLEALLETAQENAPDLRDRVRQLEERLVERIRRGDADRGLFADAVRAHVRATVLEKLAIANPRWSSVR